MRIAICDDDIEIKNKITDICDSYFCDSEEKEYLYFHCGERLLEYVGKEQSEIIDLLFLDIEMQKLDGIEVLDVLRRGNRVWRIAFVSSHSEHVLETFSILTIGFIPKPIEAAKVEKILKSFSEEYIYNQEIIVKDENNRKIGLKYENIIYLQAEGSYTQIIAKVEGRIKKYLVSRKLGDIEIELGDILFVRVHKSYIVNAEYVSGCQKMLTLVECAEKVPIGRKYRKSIEEKLRRYNLMRLGGRL